MAERYDHDQVELKWQKIWEDAHCFEAKDDYSMPKFYPLIEFPYPSGHGLHVGHPRSNTALDIIARKRRMEGYNVLYPIGWDAFGLPTENYAIKTGIHPAKVTHDNIEHFRAQLKRLQEEVVDIEDMTSGISIMDLGLNEFRLDLLEYMKQHEDIETAPKGLHTVVGQTEDSPAGVIFVLRNINDSVNIDNRNRIHPFYMVYISEEGEIVCDYLNPKKLLDTMRLLCRGKGEPCAELCKRFNDETDDGRKMGEISELLSEAINSIIDAKEENDIDSLFKSGGTSALLSAVSGLDDFELICFLVVK